MFMKRILVAAVVVAAASMSTTAAAAINLDSTPVPPTGVKFGLESLTTVGKKTVLTVDYYAISAGAAADIDVTATVGLGLAIGVPIFVRFDLTNAVFLSVPVALDFVADDSSGVGLGTAVITLSQVGNDFVIFNATPSIGASFTLVASGPLPQGIRWNRWRF